MKEIVNCQRHEEYLTRPEAKYCGFCGEELTRNKQREDKFVGFVDGNYHESYDFLDRYGIPISFIIGPTLGTLIHLLGLDN